MSEVPGRLTTHTECAPPHHRPPRDYPDDLAGDVTTTTGATLHMRPIRPDDEERLVNFHQGLSTSSVYRRYFSFHPQLSTAEVERFTQVDYVARLALVVLDGDCIVAVGRYDRVPHTSEAEVAFIVADQYQHQGLGLLLLEHLADAALARAITTFTAETQADNRCMINVFEDSGLHCSATIGHDIVSVRCELGQGDTHRGRSVTPRASDVAVRAAPAGC